MADVYSKTDTDTKLADKANVADVYSKTDTDTKLADKANTADVYSKTDADAKFATNEQLQKDVSATNLELANKADKATTLSGYGITDAYTKAEVDEADTNLQKSIDEEARKRKYSVTNLENADKQLQTNIDNEAAARKAEDARLNSEIVKTNTSLNEAASNLSKLNGTVAKGFEDLSTEDKTLQTNIDNEAAARKAEDARLEEKVNKNTSDISGMQSDSKVSEDGSYVRTTNTVGENLTALDTGLQAEVTAREDADNKLQSAIDEEARKRKYSVTNLEKADKQLQTNIDNEAAARKAADTKLVEAVNSGLSLSNDNVLQKNTTTIDVQGNVTTSKTDANEMILNKGKDNQITLNEKGIKVGTNSTVVDKDGVYTGGDTYSEAKAAMSADGKIKGANGAFTVDENGNVASKATITGETVTDGKGASMSNGTVTGKTLTDGIATITNGNINTSGTITGNKLTDGVASLQNGNLTTTGNINAHAIVATGDISGKAITGTSLNTQGGDINGGAITGTTITGTTGTFGSLTTTGNASVGGTLSSNGLTNTGNATTDTLTVNHNATVGGNLGVTGDITGKSLNVGTGDIKGGQITGTGLDVGAGTIKTIGAVETGTLETTGNATIGGNLTVDKNLTVNGEFNAKTLSSKLDENNYTTINGGKTESMNLKMGKKAGEFQASGSTFDETGSNAWAKDDESIGKSSMTADKISQSLSDTGDNPKNAASRELSQNTDNKYEITDSVVEGNQSNVENRTADTTDSQISFKDDSGKVLNKSYITQNLKKVLMGVEEGDNKTTIEQDANNITNTAKNGTITNDAGKLVNTASDTIANMAGNDITNTSTNGNIANTAANGTISNNAKNLTNTASENITNKAENGNISNIASNGTISNEAKTISNKATEALTNDAKTITNKASESVTTQIGDGSAVKSVMNGNGIANTATDKAITNDAATITNTGTTSVTNQVGNNKVLVDTTHVQSAFGNTIYTTWDESGITNNATDKTVATNAKNIQNTATGDITNTAEKGTITNKAQNLVNDASGNMTTTVGGEMKTTVTGKVTEDYKSDLSTKVGGDETHAVTGNQTTTVSGNRTVNVKGTETENFNAQVTNVKTDQRTSVGGNQTNIVGGDQQNTVSGSKTETVKGSVTEKYGSQATTVNGDQSTNIGGNQTTVVAKDQTNTVSGKKTETVKGAVNETYGSQTTKVNGDQSTTVTGKQTNSITGDQVNTIGGNQTTTVTGDSSLSAKNITNTAAEKLSNSAADIENKASKSILNQVGENTSWKMTDGTVVESVKDASGKTNQTTTTAADTYQSVKDGDNTLAKRTSSTNDNLNITDGTNTYTKITTATGNKQTVTDGMETASTNLTKSASNTLIENGTQSVLDHMAADTSYTVMNENGNGSRQQQTASEILDRVTDGKNTSEVKMTANGITNTAEGGTIYNKSKDILNEASGDILNFADGEIGNVATKITNITGDNTVTSDTNGTTFENKAYSKAIEEGSVTKTTISGNTLETGKATMDYAEVMKDLGVRGNAAVDGNTTLGKEGAETTLTVNSTSTFNKDVTMKENATVGKDLTVKGKSTLIDDVTMKSNATVEKNLTVNGQSTFNDKVTITNGGLAVTGGTTTDKLHVTSTSQFDGAATFKDIVTMEKDLNVGGNAKVAGDVTAKSYKVGDKTYIDGNGINANDQVIRNVGKGDISEGSTDAVSGGQLYETNTRVSGLETRMGTVETRVDKLDNKIDKVGANAAAMANLHPLEFDEDSKWNVAAAVGSSGSETASAVGVFYRPNENVMVNASAAMGTGENMFGGGVSLRLGHGGNKAKEAQMKAAAAENKELRAKVDDLTARMDALLSVLNPNMSKDFPDVPENHWAYEAVSRLAGNGIVEGYEDGKYHGERQMTRYEMAEIIYNALSKGAKAEKKLVEEFRPELQAMAAQKKA